MRHVIDDGFVDDDVVVYEGDAFICAAATEDGDAAEGLACGAEDDGIGRGGGGDGEEGTLQDDEFSVDGDVGAGGGKFGCVVQGGALGGGEQTDGC